MTFEEDVLNISKNFTEEQLILIIEYNSKYFLLKQKVKDAIWKLIEENPKHIVLINGLQLQKELGLD